MTGAVLLGGALASLVLHRFAPSAAWLPALMAVLVLLVFLEWHLKAMGGFNLLAGRSVILGAASVLLAGHGWVQLPTQTGLVLMALGVGAFAWLAVSLARATSTFTALLALPLLLMYALLCAIGGVVGLALTALHTPRASQLPD